MIIDSHVHIFPEKIAHKAIQKLAGISGLTPCTDGTLSDTAARMASSGVDRAVLLSIATSPSQEESINNAAVQNSADERFIPLGSVHYLSDKWEKQLEFLRDNGIRGIKLHPDYQGFMIDDRALFPIYEKCADMGMFIVFHAGWDCYSPQLIHAAPRASAAVARAFPGLKMVLAHMGGLRMPDEVLAHLVGLKNVYFDTAMAETYMDRETVCRIIKQHPAENVLFGSDCPWEDPARTLDFVDSLGLSADVRALVFAGNILRLTGMY